MRDRGVLLLLVPSVTDINGAGGVAARWREYTRELERDGWRVELWTVDATDPARTIPRYHLANFPDTLTDAPGIGFVAKVWSRLRVGRAILPAGRRVALGRAPELRRSESADLKVRSSHRLILSFDTSSKTAEVPFPARGRATATTQ